MLIETAIGIGVLAPLILALAGFASWIPHQILFGGDDDNETAPGEVFPPIPLP